MRHRGYSTRNSSDLQYIDFCVAIRVAVEMIVRSARPEDLQMPLSGIDDYITPVENFFVRTHVPVPNVNISKWSLR